MHFCQNDKVKCTPIFEKFVENVRGMLYNKTHIHHSHITGDIIGYLNSFCNSKVRENKKKINVIAYILFRFDFFFLLKGIRAGSWRTRDISIGGKNPTDINFAHIRNQVVFIDSVKYFQQSLGTLANKMTDKEKLAIKKECKKFILRDESLSRKFSACTKEDQEWVLNYLSTGKGTIPYEMITRYDSLDISPEDGNFFLLHHFYSHLKDIVMTREEYDNVKKFYRTLKLKDLAELNKIYNIQDTVTLCEIFEQRSSHLQKLFKFNPRKCNSASSFSDCVHRDKSKCLLAFPTEAEHVRIFEKTLIGGFSCVNRRLAFDTKILCSNKENKKTIFDLEINREKQMKRISTKILKTDENNQYGQAMMKPLP